MTAEFSTGQRIGDYEVLSILGAGGMGKVYKVRNVISDRIEAMKILLPDLHSNQSLADRFLREIRLLATLNHPNIAALRTALTYENQLAMIMEFVEGETLSNRLARAPVSTADAVNYSDQVLSALGYAHKLNIIHRDIKPANMMLTPQGVVKLMDFGIARSSSDGSLTTTGTTLGSLNYMPPEQVRGEAADARSDIYSFGVSLYELLTGKLPFHADSQYSLMTAHLNQDPPPPITLRGDLPEGLNEIILMAMAKDPAARFQSADAFRAALKSVPVSALAPSGTTVSSTPTPVSSSQTTLVDTAARRPLTPAPAPGTPTPTPLPRSTTPATPASLPPSPQPTMPAAQPPVHVSSSHRGLWVGIGALAGISMLLAAGIYIPRHLGTHADPNKAIFNSSPNNPGMPNASGEAAPPESPATKDDKDSDGDTVNIEGDKGSFRIDKNGNISIKSPDKEVHISASDGKVTVKGNTPPPAVPNQPQSSAVTPPVPVPSGPSPEELAKLDDEADKLNIRASSATQSIDTLRQQQIASGYNLRADISSSEQRLQAYLAKGNAALKAQDAANARKYFDMADAELSKLEKFLNH